MSLRPEAPYADRIEDNGRMLIYEGHDIPQLARGPNPKTVDQPMYNPGGSLTQNQGTPRRLRSLLQLHPTTSEPQRKDTRQLEKLHRRSHTVPSAAHQTGHKGRGSEGRRDSGDSEVRKVLVALPQEVVTLIDGELKGKLGEGYSDIIRTIMISWLSEKGYLSKDGKDAKA